MKAMCFRYRHQHSLLGTMDFSWVLPLPYPFLMNSAEEIHFNLGPDLSQPLLFVSFYYYLYTDSLFYLPGAFSTFTFYYICLTWILSMSRSRYVTKIQWLPPPPLAPYLATLKALGYSMQHIVRVTHCVDIDLSLGDFLLKRPLTIIYSIPEPLSAMPPNNLSLLIMIATTYKLKLWLYERDKQV